MAKQAGLKAQDNPFDFFDNWEAWNQCELHYGFDPMSWIARIVPSIEELKDIFEYGDDEKLLLDEYERRWEEGIDTLVRLDPFQRYKKIYKGE